MQRIFGFILIMGLSFACFGTARAGLLSRGRGTNSIKIMVPTFWNDHLSVLNRSGNRGCNIKALTAGRNKSLSLEESHLAFNRPIRYSWEKEGKFKTLQILDPDRLGWFQPKRLDLDTLQRLLKDQKGVVRASEKFLNMKGIPNNGHTRLARKDLKLLRWDMLNPAGMREYLKILATRHPRRMSSHLEANRSVADLPQSTCNNLTFEYLGGRTKPLSGLLSRWQKKKRAQISDMSKWIWEIKTGKYLATLGELISDYNLIYNKLKGRFHFHLSFEPDHQLDQRKAASYIGLVDMAIFLDALETGKYIAFNSFTKPYQRPNLINAAKILKKPRRFGLRLNKKLKVITTDEKFHFLALRNRVGLYKQKGRIGLELRGVEDKLKAISLLKELTNRLKTNRWGSGEYFDNPIVMSKEETVKKVSALLAESKVVSHGKSIKKGDVYSIGEMIKNARFTNWEVDTGYVRTFDERIGIPNANWSSMRFLSREQKRNIGKATTKFNTSMAILAHEIGKKDRSPAGRDSIDWTDTGFKIVKYLNQWAAEVDLSRAFFAQVMR